jgi:hypothetical protein
MLSTILSAITWDPTIRGILICVVAVVVFPGSIYLIVSTNSGFRLGFLIAGACLFGWMTIMGSVWWIYGIGLVGRAPAWMPLEINYTRTAAVATPVVDSLPPPESLPDPSELISKYPLIEVVAKSSEGKDYKPKSLSNIVTIATPLVLTDADAVAATIRPGIKKNGTEFLADHPETKALIDNDSDEQLAKEIAKEAKTIRADIEDQLHGWCLLSESDTRRGEASSASDAALAEAKAFGDNTTTASYIVDDVFFKGGKEPCAPITERSTIDQAWHRLATTFELKNPKLYSVVTVTKAKDVTVAPGETPPPPSKEPGASTTSVVLLRNLGNKRFVPFCFTLVCGLTFAVFAIMLHTRDKAAMAARAEFEGKK